MAIKRLPSTGDAPRTTGVPDSLEAGGPADSAGFPWQGRSFDHHGTAFADDDGHTPVELAAAVAGVRLSAAHYVAARGVDADPEQLGDALRALAGAHSAVISALAGARVMVPMLAEAGDLGETPDGRVVEKTQELSIVTVSAPDGRRVLPIFSSVDVMTGWNPGSRPIPVPAAQAAVAAAQEETDLMILDAASVEVEFGIRRPALRALALGETYVPAWADPEVHAAFVRAVAGMPDVVSVSVVPADPQSRLIVPELDVLLRLRAGLDRAGLTGILSEVQQRIAAERTIAEQVDSMRLVPLAAG